MGEDGIEELIARHVGAEALQAELAFLALHGEDKKRVVDVRLRAIDEYLSIDDPAVSDVDRLAEAIGVSRRQFYRLLAKFRDKGPVRGLLPGIQNVRRASAARDGLSPEVEAIIKRELRARPQMAIGALRKVVADECAKYGIEMPSEWHFRSRVHKLRVHRGVSARIAPGQSIVIDQVCLDLMTEGEEGTKYYPIATLVMDKGTSCILGGSVSLRPNGIEGARKAIEDMAGRTIAGIQAFELRELLWTLPKEADVLEILQGIGLSTGNNVTLNIQPALWRRQGRAIMWLLGDQLTNIEFRSQAVPGEIVSRVPDPPGLSLKTVEWLLSVEIDEWNKEVVSLLAPFPSSPDGAPERSLSYIAAELQEVVGSLKLSI